MRRERLLVDRLATDEFRLKADRDILFCQRVEDDGGTFWQHALFQNSELAAPRTECPRGGGGPTFEGSGTPP
jgi:hypothetical protein